ncbi:hypothetical protein Trydic_g7073 [Trypoxylus dichotomus]
MSRLSTTFTKFSSIVKIRADDFIVSWNGMSFLNNFLKTEPHIPILITIRQIKLEDLIALVRSYGFSLNEHPHHANLMNTPICNLPVPCANLLNDVHLPAEFSVLLGCETNNERRSSYGFESAGALDKIRKKNLISYRANFIIYATSVMISNIFRLKENIAVADSFNGEYYASEVKTTETRQCERNIC